VNRLLLYGLFTEWNNTEGLVKLGIGDYFLLLELITERVESLKTFDDFVFTCETLWLKSTAQQTAFRQLFENRRKNVLEIIDWFNRKQEASKTNPVDSITGPKPVDNTSTTGADEESKNTSKNDEQVIEKTPDAPRLTNNEPEGLVGINLGAHTEGAAADGQTQIFSFTVSNEVLSASRRYMFGTEYFPVNSRILQQSWRSLYNHQEGEALGELSMPATIKKISREGRFLDFVYEPSEINRLSLFIFIDQGGSMTAQEAFGAELVRTAFASEVHKTVKPYYFYNIPQPTADDEEVFVVYDEQRTASFTTAKLFKGLNKKNIVLLLYSDCGAIKGSVNKERLDATEMFLKTMLKYTGFIAWLNPAPMHRWNSSAAGAIRLRMPEVGMFEADRLGIAQAVDTLKGKLTPTLKKQYAAAASRNK
jgi:uncharacterized protein